MGILNVTPDSFSDGGRYFSADQTAVAAIDQGIRLLRDGATIIDIGGESTRPYSTPVSAEEELDRVIPVIEGILLRRQAIISIDTSKAAVAQAAIDAGAEIINDVTGLEGDPLSLEVACRSKAGVCAMHMQGSPQTMQDAPNYGNVVDDIFAYLLKRKLALLEAGIESDRICLDPGIGFGKTHQHNLDLIAGVSRFHDLGCPILAGHSRKGFIGSVQNDKECERDSGTAGVSAFLTQNKIQVIRVHNVAANKRTVDLFKAVGGATGSAIRLPAH